MGGPRAVPERSDKPFVFGAPSIASDAAASLSSSPSTPAKRYANASSRRQSPPLTKTDPLLHSGRLLGDLPSLTAHKSPLPADDDVVDDDDNKPRRPIAQASVAVSTDDVPKQFLCEIARKPLQDPVITPSGHVFERKLIEVWMERNGSICPITGEPLSVYQLKEATEVKRQMEEWRLRKTLQATQGESKNQFADASAPATEQEEDPYEF
jgi:hypothetical protein